MHNDGDAHCDPAADRPGWPPPIRPYPQQPYPQQGYPPPGYPHQGYPPPGYPHQGYPPPGYPPPGYPTLPPVALQPGVIPLRPLTLGDIFNGAVRYVRVNPKATLGWPPPSSSPRPWG
ncbi:hypothetical protein MMUR_66440 [Mycolicibacterium murale]|uniref:Uncharacterized protein n=1 Tax=Mycolicibacterium murale TaxID=182220 RepID=A0A7I9WYJ2_9MYCO|nr:hypothetical protein MMUR_66440 [Mycolicibacterium murale]